MDRGRGEGGGTKREGRVKEGLERESVGAKSLSKSGVRLDKVEVMSVMGQRSSIMKNQYTNEPLKAHNSS